MKGLADSEIDSAISFLEAKPSKNTAKSHQELVSELLPKNLSGSRSVEILPAYEGPGSDYKLNLLGREFSIPMLFDSGNFNRILENPENLDMEELSENPKALGRLVGGLETESAKDIIILVFGTQVLYDKFPANTEFGALIRNTNKTLLINKLRSGLKKTLDIIDRIEQRKSA